MKLPKGAKKARNIDILFAAAQYLVNHEEMKIAAPEGPDPEIVAELLPTFESVTDAIYVLWKIGQNLKRENGNPLSELLAALKASGAQVEVLPMSALPQFLGDKKADS